MELNIEVRALKKRSTVVSRSLELYIFYQRNLVSFQTRRFFVCLFFLLILHDTRFSRHYLFNHVREPYSIFCTSRWTCGLSGPNRPKTRTFNMFFDCDRVFWTLLFCGCLQPREFSAPVS